MAALSSDSCMGGLLCCDLLHCSAAARYFKESSPGTFSGKVHGQQQAQVQCVDHTMGSELGEQSLSSDSRMASTAQSADHNSFLALLKLTGHRKLP